MGKFRDKILIPAIITLAGTMFIACNEVEYKVTFYMNGGSAVTSQTIELNGKVSMPQNPTKDGYIFAGWYKDENFTKQWDFSTDIVTYHTTIYAKWIENFSINYDVKSLTTDGYSIEIENNKANIEINGNYKIFLKIDTNKYLTENFSLNINSQSLTPTNIISDDNINIYTYEISNVLNNQNITIENLNKTQFSINFNNAENVEIVDVEGNKNSVKYGSDYSFYLTMKEGYTQSINTVKVFLDDDEIIAQNGKYTIQNVTKDTILKVKNVIKNTYSISYPTLTHSQITGKNSYTYGDDLQFVFKLNEGYTKQKLNDLKFLINSYSIDKDITYNPQENSYIITIASKDAKGNLEISLNDTLWDMDKYEITLPTNQTGYTITTNQQLVNNKYLVSYGEDFKFEFTLDNDYNKSTSFKLLVNNINKRSALENTTDNTVTIENIKEDITIKVEDLQQNKFVVVPSDTDETFSIINYNNYSQPIAKNEDYQFKIKLSEGYETVGSIRVYAYEYSLDNVYTKNDESFDRIGTKTELIANNNIYSLANIAENIKIIVTGIQKKILNVSVPSENNRFEFVGNSTFNYGDNYSFNIKVKDAYKSSINSIAVKVNNKNVLNKEFIDEDTVKCTVYNVTNNINSIEVTGLYKDKCTITYTTVSGNIIGSFANYSGLENYTQTTFTETVNHGELPVGINSNVSIVAPEHYRVNPNKIWKNMPKIINDDITVVVDFIPIKYYITFDMQGGTNNKLNNTENGNDYIYSYTIENGINLATPYRKIANTNNNYNFDGWYYNDNNVLKPISSLTPDDYNQQTVAIAVWSLRVGSERNYKTLTEAVNVAVENDTIILDEETFDEYNVVVDKNLTIKGTGENTVVKTTHLVEARDLSYSIISKGVIFVDNATLNIEKISFNNLTNQSELYTVCAIKSSVSMNNINIVDMQGLCAVGENNEVLIDNTNVVNNSNYYAISTFGCSNEFVVNIQNSSFDSNYGIEIRGYKAYETNVTIKNNVFSNEDEFQKEKVCIRFVGSHNIIEMNNTFNISQDCVLEKLENLSDTDAFDNEKIALYRTKFINNINEGTTSKEIIITNSNNDYYSYIQNADNIKVLISKDGEKYIQSALNFAKTVEIVDKITINSNIIVPENKILILTKDSKLILDKTITVYGTLQIDNLFECLGEVVVENTGLCLNATSIRKINNNELGLIESYVEINNQQAGISGQIIPATKNSNAYKMFDGCTNTTGYYISFMVYAGIENANKNVDNIFITNENGLLYANSTHKTNALQDKINKYGYLELCIDANVVDESGELIPKLSKLIVEVCGKTYEIDVQLSVYEPEILADRADDLGYYYNINNDYQIITEKEDLSYESDADVFKNYVIDGCLMEATNNSLQTKAPLNYYITFRQYVGLQYKFKKVDESYMVNNESVSNANLHKYAGTVDEFGYLDYVVDARVSCSEYKYSTDFESFSVTFELEGVSYEFRLEKGDIYFDEYNGKLVNINNSSALGIESKYLVVGKVDNVNTIYGYVVKVEENAEIKNNSIFYDSVNNADGYFLSYKLWVGNSDGRLKDSDGNAIANKNIVVQVSGYQGRTIAGTKVLGNGYVEFITEVVKEGGVFVGGTINITYTISGCEEKQVSFSIGEIIDIQDRTEA